MKERTNGNYGPKNQPQYVYYQGAGGTDWIIKILYALLFFSIIWTIGLFTTCSCDFNEEISEEYNIPLETVEDIDLWHFGDIKEEFNIFPIPHSSLYITTKSGEEVELASEFFGIISLHKEAIDKYFFTDKAKSSVREWNEWWDSAWDDIDKKYKDLSSDYH